jgi:hypothetical protein
MKHKIVIEIPPYYIDNLVQPKVSLYLGLPSTEYFWFRVQLLNLELGEIEWGTIVDIFGFQKWTILRYH